MNLRDVKIAKYVPPTLPCFAEDFTIFLRPAPEI
jgi:hypothetical protein